MKNKDSLRADMKMRRNLLSDSAKEIAQEEGLKNLDVLLKDKRAVMLYMSFRSEIGTLDIIKSLINCGKRIYLPKVTGENIVPVLYTGDFSKGAFGVEEPIGDEADEKDIEAVVVPGLAFDPFGQRLGYGKGFYDRFLKNLNALKIGYCYDFQVVEKIDADEWDEPLDYVVTDKKIYRCR